MDVNRRTFLRLVGATGAAAAAEPWLSRPVVAELAAPTTPWRMQAFAPGGLVPVGGLVAVAEQAGWMVGRWYPDRPMTVGGVVLYHGRFDVREWEFLPVRLGGGDSLQVTADWTGGGDVGTRTR
jgi:hypothetical protein